MTTIAPADPDQTRAAVRAVMEIPAPAYLRVGKGGNPPVPGLDGRFALGRPEVIRTGGPLLMLCTGAIVHDVLEAADLLAGEGHRVAVALLAHLGFTGSPALR